MLKALSKSKVSSKRKTQGRSVPDEFRIFVGRKGICENALMVIYFRVFVETVKHYKVATIQKEGEKLVKALDEHRKTNCETVE